MKVNHACLVLILFQIPFATFASPAAPYGSGGAPPSTGGPGGQQTPGAPPGGQTGNPGAQGQPGAGGAPQGLPENCAQVGGAFVSPGGQVFRANPKGGKAQQLSAADGDRELKKEKNKLPKAQQAQIASNPNFTPAQRERISAGDPQPAVAAISAPEPQRGAAPPLTAQGLGLVAAEETDVMVVDALLGSGSSSIKSPELDTNGGSSRIVAEMMGSRAPTAETARGATSSRGGAARKRLLASTARKPASQGMAPIKTRVPASVQASAGASGIKENVFRAFRSILETYGWLPESNTEKEKPPVELAPAGGHKPN